MYEYKQYRGRQASSQNKIPENNTPKVIGICAIIAMTALIDLLPNNFFHDPFEYLDSSKAEKSVGLDVPENHINEVGVALNRSERFQKQVDLSQQRQNSEYKTASGFINFMKDTTSDSIASNPEYFKKNFAILSPESLEEIQSFSNEINSQISKYSPTIAEAHKDLEENGGLYSLQNLIQDAETIEPY